MGYPNLGPRYIVIPGGSLVGGTGVFPRIAFWLDPDEITSSANLNFLSAAPGKLGIGTATPARSLTIDGQNLDGVLTFQNCIADYLTALYRRNIELQHNGGVVWKVGAGTNSFAIVKHGADQTLRILRAVGEAVGTAPVYIAQFDTSNRFSIGTVTGVELLTLAGVAALGETAAPTATAAYAKLFAYDRSGHSAIDFIDDTGVRRGPLGEFVGCLLSAAANQSIPDVTDTPVVIDTTIFDAGGFKVGSTIVIPAGYAANSVWRIKGKVRWDTPVGAGQGRLRIMKGAGLLNSEASQIGAAAAMNIASSVDVLDTGAAGAVYSLEARQNTGLALNILGTGAVAQTEFSIERAGVRP